MKTILLIERESEQQTACQSGLEASGYRVVLASNSREVIRVFGIEKPDLAIVSPHPLRAEELQALQAIKTIDESLPIIIYSRHSLFGDDFRYWLADCVISSGSNLDVLKEKVSVLLNEGSRTPF